MLLAEIRDGQGRPGGLRGAVTVAADLFDEPAAGVIAARLVRVLAAVAADPGVRLRAVQVLDPAERAQVLEEWNDTAAAVPDATVAELVAARAAPCRMRWRWLVTGLRQLRGAGDAGGAAGAVTCGGRGGPGDGGGAVPGPGLELVTAVLGVWQAGAAYLPLDPGLPAARIAFMLADSRAGAGRRGVAAGGGPAGRAGPGH